MNALFANPVLVAAVTLCGTALLGTLFLIHHHLRATRLRDAIDWKRVQGFRGDSYRPLVRLLSADDYVFLQRLPGYQPVIASQLRRERRRIQRRFLKRLEADFTQLHLVARTLVRDQEHDRPELVLALVRTGAEFRWNLFRIRLGLALEPLGLPALALRPADTERLVDAAIWMQAQVKFLYAPSAVPVAG
ncbi:MAG: hypothetical protein IPJ98_13195 [Bryobacterales bacterium]|nr:hypothetical protein [Bryobacterales bacterium]